MWSGGLLRLVPPPCGRVTLPPGPCGAAVGQMRNFTRMKIAKIIIPNFQQFNAFELDLTYPEGHAKVGQPLEKVCFIGRNGTGKSTLLRLVNEFVKNMYNRDARTIFKVLTRDKGFIYPVLLRNDKVLSSNEIVIVREDIDKDQNLWVGLLENRVYSDDETFQQYWINEPQLLEELSFLNYPYNLIVYSPAESGNNEQLAVQDIPSASLNESLTLFENFPVTQEVSVQNVKDFWRLLIYLVKKRESDLLAYQDRSENQEKTLKQVREEFNRQHPEILKEIAGLWNQILENAGLEFDYQGAKVPVQLTDNLQAYIKLRSTGETVPYNALSTGIRNFIFRLGHIYALYFNRQIESGFLLIDEPENSLFPDFLYDLVDIYQRIIHNTQFFVATHSPIIAAQFEPEERFILDFNEIGFVTARRGVTAVGDDPNDMLVQDFGVRSLLGPKGMEKWERFIELKMLIKHTSDPIQKEQLVEEYAQIGRDYNFPAR